MLKRKKMIKAFIAVTIITTLLLAQGIALADSNAWSGGNKESKGSCVEPVLVNGNPKTDDSAYKQYNYIEFKIDQSPEEKTYTVDNSGKTITINNKESTFNSFSWSSNFTIYKVVVKASSWANVYDYEAQGSTGDQYIHPPFKIDNKGEQTNTPFGISHVCFWYREQQPSPAIEIIKKVDSEKQITIEQDKLPKDVTYSFTVKNTGNVDLENVTVKDSLFGTEWSNVIGTLAAGAETSFTKTYTINQIPENNSIVNTAIVNGKYGEINVTDNDTATVTITPTPIVKNPAIKIIKLVKSAEMKSYENLIEISENKLPKDVTYSFTVKNTGNVDLENVTVKDSLFGTEWSNVIGTLAAGAETSFTKTYTINQIPENNSIVNTAIVNGKYGEINVTDNDTATVSVQEEQGNGNGGSTNNPGIELIKSVTPSTAKIGEKVVYSFTVRNTGNVTLTEITIIDPLFGNDWSIKLSELAAGASSMNYQQEHMISEKQVANGQIKNTALVEGVFEENTVTDEADAVVSITTDNNGGNNGGGDNNGDTGTIPNEPIIVPDEPPVSNPPINEKPIVVPDEPIVETPQKQEDLPFTGGSGITYLLSGLTLAGFGVWLKKKK